MSGIDKSIEIVVAGNHDYRFRVGVSDLCSVAYEENGRTENIEITFGSVEEMEETARAMLFVAKAARELGIK